MTPFVISLTSTLYADGGEEYSSQGGEGNAEIVVAPFIFPKGAILDFAYIHLDAYFEAFSSKYDVSVTPRNVDCDGTPCPYSRSYDVEWTLHARAGASTPAGPMVLWFGGYNYDPDSYLYPSSIEMFRDGFTIGVDLSAWFHPVENQYSPIFGKNSITVIRQELLTHMVAVVNMDVIYIVEDTPLEPVPEPATTGLTIAAVVLGCTMRARRRLIPQIMHGRTPLLKLTLEN